MTRSNARRESHHADTTFASPSATAQPKSRALSLPSLNLGLLLGRDGDFGEDLEGQPAPAEPYTRRQLVITATLVCVAIVVLRLAGLLTASTLLALCEQWSLLFLLGIMAACYRW